MLHLPAKNQGKRKKGKAKRKKKSHLAKQPPVSGLSPLLPSAFEVPPLTLLSLNENDEARGFDPHVASPSLTLHFDNLQLESNSNESKQAERYIKFELGKQGKFTSSVIFEIHKDERETLFEKLITSCKDEYTSIYLTEFILSEEEMDTIIDNLIEHKHELLFVEAFHYRDELLSAQQLTKLMDVFSKLVPENHGRFGMGHYQSALVQRKKRVVK